VSASGTTRYVAAGSVGTGAATWTFDADILATWTQTARNARLPGARTASFNFTTMARYVPGRAGTQRNPIRDVAATVSVRASSSDSYGAARCRIRAAAPTEFFSGSAVNELFLDSRKSGSDLAAYVEGQNPLAVRTPSCNGVKLPLVYDIKRERIQRVVLSLLQKTKKGTKVSLVLLRTVPIVEENKRVGTVTETAKITLMLQSGF
jgi:hypothetical protein